MDAKNLWDEIECLHKKIDETIEGALSNKEKFRPTFENLSDLFFDGNVIPSKKDHSLKGKEVSNFKKDSVTCNKGIYYFYVRLQEGQTIESFKEDWSRFKKYVEKCSGKVPSLNGCEATLIGKRNANTAVGKAYLL